MYSLLINFKFCCWLFTVFLQVFGEKSFVKLLLTSHLFIYLHLCQSVGFKTSIVKIKNYTSWFFLPASIRDRLYYFCYSSAYYSYLWYSLYLWIFNKAYLPLYLDFSSISAWILAFYWDFSLRYYLAYYPI